MDDIYERYGLPRDVDLDDPGVKEHIRFLEHRRLMSTLIEGVHLKPKRKLNGTPRKERELRLARSSGYDSVAAHRRALGEDNAANEDNQLFSRYLTQTLDDLGMTAIDAAAETGLSAATIRNWTSGRTLPKETSFRDLQAGLDLPYESLDEVLGYMRTG